MHPPKPKRVFRLIDNSQIDARFPFALVDECSTVIQIGARTRWLADWALENGADEVQYDGEIAARADL